ncbi:type II toxin-antitoxin system VapC family toxin [Roseimaritima sediminicola]|uniref:type II toxin-antitoxin system VapC family toxin n=1 Tax=Roseimaritima sediminicola TaxID=2662066 RepID=UPI00129830DD|nr:type II toxin-antitoxin system VapC family toxin [Roseimaritima sediminicola]
MQSVYLETTVIGNIAGRVHPDLAMAARQSVTRRWWDTAAERYELFVSALVVEECNGGDPQAASERFAVIGNLPMLDGGDDAKSLADSLLDGNAVPRSEPRDATHIAIAAVNGIELLATWNFKHILNPTTQHIIDAVCRKAGYEPATICTPEQLLEAFDDS